MAFTSHADAAFDVCFENQLVTNRMLPPLSFPFPFEGSIF